MDSLSRRTVLAGIGALAAVPLIGTGVAQAAPESVIWDGDAARGTSVFDGLEKEPGSITVVNDATYGKSFRYETWDNADGSKERCESRGLRLPTASCTSSSPGRAGQTRYPGPTLWGTHVNHKWGVYRSGPNSGHATALLNHAKLGSAYADVAL